MTVRTRFAPSPTGYLHVGGVRTALFAWLYAKKHQGQFILRIEDTDRERSTDASIQAILEGMSWLGLDYDEGPFYQTKRLSRYQEIIGKLLDEGKAYRCYCSKERLDNLREAQMQAKQKPKYDGHCRNQKGAEADESFVIRFKNPQTGEVTFNDHVYGQISVDNQELDDLIIQKSDGMPTYNLAVVVDDFDMGITDVIRGDDHINNTPRQINILNAIGANVPRYAHLPMILGDDGKRLSKRHGAVNIMQFKEEGYLAQAMLNYLVRLGWSSGDQEIFSIAEMIEKFSLDSISKGGAAFSFDKLNWLNQHYIKTMDTSIVAGLLKETYQKANIDIKIGPELINIIPTFAERCKTLADMVNQTKFLFIDSVEFDEKAVSKQLKPKAKPILQALTKQLDDIPNWEPASIAEAIDSLCQELEIKFPKVAQPLRVAITGGSMSPSIDLTLAWTGKERTIERIKNAIAMIPDDNA
jgi:glutamyl-tRNA synthetase